MSPRSSLQATWTEQPLKPLNSFPTSQPQGLVCDQLKAEDIVVLHVAPLVSWTSYIVLVTVKSRPQMLAVQVRRRTGPSGCSSAVPPLSDRLRVTFRPDIQFLYALSCQKLA